MGQAWRIDWSRLRSSPRTGPAERGGGGS
jgi:hypothetical protein